MFSRISLRNFSVVSDAVKLVRAVENNRIVTITWSDGHVGSFPLIWLRDTSPDEKTYSISSTMKARNLLMNEFDVEQEPLSMKLDKKLNQLVMKWPGDVESRFPSSWLRVRDPSSKALRERRRRVYLFPEKTWGKEKIEKSLKKFDHEAVLNDDKTLHDFLEAVCLDGIAVIKNGPRGKKGAVEAIGARIGMIKRTHFGIVFEVVTKPDASNMAYTSTTKLPFHTDFTSLSDPPQLQMLHMFKRAEEGGNSLFVDGFHVAEQLRRERPEVFDILTKYSMEFIEEGSDVHEGPDGKMMKFDYDMCARHKVIKLNDAGRVVQIQFGNAMRSWFYDCEPSKIQEIYRAMKVFTEYCYDERNVLKIGLEEGDTVLWANTRVLHTRDMFRNGPDIPRTLTGCYFEWDIVKSRVRVLRDKLNLPQNQPSV